MTRKMDLVRIETEKGLRGLEKKRTEYRQENSRSELVEEEDFSEGTGRLRPNP